MLRARELLTITSGYAHAVRPLVEAVPDGENLLVSTGGDGAEIHRWSIASGDSMWRCEAELPGCNDVVLFSLPDGRRIVAVATEDGVERWNAVTGEPLDGLDSSSAGWTVWGLAAGTLPDGRSALVGAGNNGAVQRWDAASGEPMGAPLRGHGTTVMAVGLMHLSVAETVIVSGDDSGFLRRWNAESGDPIGDPAAGHASRVGIIVPLPGVGARKLFASSAADEICRWDMATGEQVGGPLTTGADVFSLATACPGGTPLLLAAGADGQVVTWNANTGEPSGITLRGVHVAALDQPGGTALVVTGTSQGEIIVYSLSE